MGGEGIEPYELHSHDLYSLERLMAEQACAWYMMADIRAYSREDEVILPPKAPTRYSKGKGRRYEAGKVNAGRGKGIDTPAPTEDLFFLMFLHMMMSLRILDITPGLTFSPKAHIGIQR